MFEQIVVALDGSEHSHRALENAKHLAECSGATLWLVHAFVHTSDLWGHDKYDELVMQRKTAGQDILDEAREKLGETTFDIHEELLEEPAAEAILNVAEVRNADLIVMGTRGHGSLQGMLVGSVGNKVLNHAHCPVMLVR